MGLAIAAAITHFDFDHILTNKAWRWCEQVVAIGLYNHRSALACSQGEWLGNRVTLAITDDHDVARVAAVVVGKDITRNWRIDYRVVDVVLNFRWCIEHAQ